MREVGKNIRQLRIAQGMSQEELAGHLYVSRQTVSNYENGKSSPDLEMLMKVAEVLGVDENSLLHGDKDAMPDKNRYLHAAIELIMIVLLFIILQVSMKRVEAYRQIHYVTSLSWLMTGYIRPIVYLISGWLGMDALNRLFIISLPKGIGKSIRGKQMVRIVRVGMIVFVLAFMANQFEITVKALYYEYLSVLAGGTGSYSYQAHELFGDHVGGFLIQTVSQQWFAIFGVIGALLWLTGRMKISRN